ncbi:hypothetical protein ACFWYW_56445 [Nonomuraea sp. NPDC059023]|uniref:hypothetical protein n=1 Tax=unclassified Nonomuraea TaxID=2593643 RepID=UPI0036C8842E
MRTMFRKAAAATAGLALAGGVLFGVASAARADVVPLGWELYKAYGDSSEASRKLCFAEGRRLFGNQFKCSPGALGWALYFWS